MRGSTWRAGTMPAWKISPSASEHVSAAAQEADPPEGGVEGARRRDRVVGREQDVGVAVLVVGEVIGGEVLRLELVGGVRVAPGAVVPTGAPGKGSPSKHGGRAERDVCPRSLRKPGVERSGSTVGSGAEVAARAGHLVVGRPRTHARAHRRGECFRLLTCPAGSRPGTDLVRDGADETPLHPGRSRLPLNSCASSGERGGGWPKLTFSAIAMSSTVKISTTPGMSCESPRDLQVLVPHPMYQVVREPFATVAPSQSVRRSAQSTHPGSARSAARMASLRPSAGTARPSYRDLGADYFDRLTADRLTRCSPPLGSPSPRQTVPHEAAATLFCAICRGQTR